MFEEINNHFDVSNVNILESDSLNEKKYVLKLDKKKSKKQEPKIEEPKAEDEFDFGDDVENTEEESFDFESEEGETEGGEESFDFESEEELESGMYFVLLPNKQYFQLIIVCSYNC